MIAVLCNNMLSTRKGMVMATNNKQTEVIYHWKKRPIPAPALFKYQSYTFLRLVTREALLGFPKAMVSSLDMASLLEYEDDIDFNQRAKVIAKKILLISFLVTYEKETRTTRFRLVLNSSELTQAKTERLVGYEALLNVRRNSINYIDEVGNKMDYMITRHFFT